MRNLKMTIKKHKKYFLRDELYELARSEKEEPFDMLNVDEWLILIHHLNAHRIDLRKHGNYACSLDSEEDEISIGLILRNMLFDYIDENNRGELIPNGEKELFSKAELLYETLQENYEIDAVKIKGRNCLDVRRKASGKRFDIVNSTTNRMVMTSVFTDYPPRREDKLGLEEFISKLEEIGWAAKNPQTTCLVKHLKILSLSFCNEYLRKYAVVWKAYIEDKDAPLKKLEHKGILYLPATK